MNIKEIKVQLKYLLIYYERDLEEAIDSVKYWGDCCKKEGANTLITSEGKLTYGELLESSTERMERLKNSINKIKEFIQKKETL